MEWMADISEGFAESVFKAEWLSSGIWQTGDRWLRANKALIKTIYPLMDEQDSFVPLQVHPFHPQGNALSLGEHLYWIGEQ
jgi:hypothetical protein